MLTHYFAAAWRAIGKAPFTNAANVLTLALGLTCFVAAHGVAAYWKAGDRHHPGADRIHYVCTYCESGQPGEIQSPARLARELRSAMPDLEIVARLGFPSEYAVASDGSKAFIQGVPADAELLTLFPFDFLEGSAQQALRSPDSVVLSVETARQLFGSAPALGRVLRIDGSWEATVAGVFTPDDRPSFLGSGTMHLGMLVNLEADVARKVSRLDIPAELADGWNSGSVETFVRLPPTQTATDFQERLDAFSARAIPGRDNGRPEVTLTAHPVGTLTASLVTARFSMGEDLGVSAGALLIGLGTLILLVAAMNFSNLAAAQVAARIKEAALHRVLGARPRQVLVQYLVEAGLLTLLALLLAVAFVALAAPAFRSALGVDPVHFLRTDASGLAVLLGVALATTLLVSIWPAFTLLRARPADAIGAGRVRSSASGWLSQVLIGLQFMSASFLAILVAVLEMQHAHLRDTVARPGADPVVLLNDLKQTGILTSTVLQEMRDLPHVRSVTAVQFPPWSGQSNARMLGRTGEPGSTGIRTMVKSVGPDYFETFDRALLAGRLFDPERDAGGVLPDGSTGEVLPVLIDLALARSLGFADAAAAMDQPIYATPGSPRAAPGQAIVRVAGVVQADLSNLNASFGGSLFVFDPTFTRAQIPAIRVERANVGKALEGIREEWDALAPYLPLRAEFSDELFERRIAPFRQIRQTFLVLCVAAFLIASVGILAVAVHATGRRRHEIGVRKTLGAGTGRILRMLLADLSKPVLIGSLVAWPLAWVVSQVFLGLFIERAEPGPFLYVGTLLGTLGIAWLAVGGMAWRAARLKPALVLRAE
jgi:putative ABC transport system permease protein